MDKKNGYTLMRAWFDFSYTEPNCGVYHTSLFAWIVDLNNRFAWKEKFGLPTADTMEVLKIGNRRTYSNTLSDLQKWGFIKIITESKNQYQSCIISICPFKSEQASHQALTQALHMQSTSTASSTASSTAPIDKHINKETVKLSKKIKSSSSATPSDGIYKECMNIYNVFILEITGIGAKIDGQQGKALNEIIKYLKGQVKNKEDFQVEIPKALNAILSNYEKWQDFHKGQLTLSQINKNLINIISSIKNGKSVRTHQHSAEAYRS